jgi:hypothetical protein
VKSCIAYVGVVSPTLLAGCAQSGDPSGVHEDLPPCGSYETSWFGSIKVYPAVDEGEGKVSLQRGYGDAHAPEDGGPSDDYRLYDWRSGKAIGFNAYRDFSISYDDPNRPPTLNEFVETARKNGLMTQPQKLLAQAKRAGFRPATPDQNGPPAEYITCACQHFYPDLAARTSAP